MRIINHVFGLSKQPVGKTTYGKLFVAFLVFVVLTSIFIGIGDEVLDGDTLRSDTNILLHINERSTSVLDGIAIAVTHTGDLVTIFVFVSVLLGVLWKRQLIRTIIQVLFIMGGAAILNGVLKLLFQRERPELWDLLTYESTYSFPSGHALMTSALTTTLIIILWNTKWRWLIVGCGVLYVIFVGLSRLYLGVHYPTDVIAGWCIGVAWAIIVSAIIGAIKWRQQS